MLNSANRMSRKRFGAVFANSALQHTPHFLIRTSPSESEKSHGAAVVSKKVVRGAVGRHFLKRRVYSTLQTLFPTLTSPVDIIVIAKSGADSISFEELKEEIEKIIIKK